MWRVGLVVLALVIVAGTSVFVLGGSDEPEYRVFITRESVTVGIGRDVGSKIWDAKVATEAFEEVRAEGYVPIHVVALDDRRLVIVGARR